MLGVQRSWQAGVLLFGVLGLGGGILAPQKSPQAKLIFSKDVLPILSNKCFACHGPDASSRKAELRLDTQSGATANRNGTWAVVPGKPENSLIVKRIHDKDDPMPPERFGKPLTDTEKEILTRWIKEGASYGKIWSFESLPLSVAVPQTKSTWPKSDIDRFILAKMQKAGLNPSAPADKLRWLRRVTLDLTGLPPTEQEIAAFRTDNSAAAYEKVVDRLLASPHFGERTAVEWLDAARYSDSYGYQSDLLMPTWPYRDWVIRAFNTNLPYDQFLRDQIAGDLVPNATREQKLATAFNRLHRQSNEGGSIALEFKTEYAADRTTTFGTSVLGLTMNCARCHDHKFDPITQKEFYQLFAYFNSIDEYGLLLSTEIVPTPSLLLPNADQEKQLAQLQKEAKDAKTAMDLDVSGRIGTWLAANPKAVIPDIQAQISFEKLDGGMYANSAGGAAFGANLGSPEGVSGKVGQGVKLDGDNGIVVRGLPGRERFEPFTWAFWVKDSKRTSTPVVLMHRTGGTDVGFCGSDLMLENGYLTARIMRHWPGNALAVRSKKQISFGGWSHVAWSYDGLGSASGLHLYIDGKEAAVEVVQDSLWKSINAYGDLAGSGGDWTFGTRFRDAGFKNGVVDEAVFASRSLSPIEIAQLFDGESLGKALAAPDAHKPELTAYYKSAIDPQSRELASAARSAQQKLMNLENGINEISVMQDAPKEIPSYLLARGAYDAPRNASTKVSRGTPFSLPPLKPQGPNNRLALAKWVTRPDNPLTARVAVNRLWQMMFGVGIVETSENFGVQGSLPTHPELLDYLALKFIKSGWNVKAMLRELALSATYRQDSALTAQLKKADPENKLWARGPSRRMSAEMVRDTVLAASGLLVDKLGGPPVNPYQPAGIWTENNTMSPGFVQSKGEGLYRRSIYTTWKRTTPMPSMMLFDATSREACVVRRPNTNTPLQALVLLNDVQYIEAARVLAEKVLEMDISDEARVKIVFMRLVGREVKPAELSVLARTFEEQYKEFKADPDLAQKLIKLGDSKANPKLDLLSLASMTVTVQTVMNSDLVIWKR